MEKQSKKGNIISQEIVWRIKYSLVNAINLFSDEDSVQLLPIIDRFLLLLQKNIGIEIYYAHDQKKIFSFLDILNLVDLSITFNSNKETFKIGCIKIDSNKRENFDLYAFYFENDEKNISPLKNYDRTDFEGLIRRINGKSQLSKPIREGLFKAFLNGNRYNEKVVELSYNLDKELINSDIAEYCKSKIREILDISFSSFRHNILVYSAEFKMPTIFTVVRYPFIRGDFKYSAQILFSNVQKNSIRKKNDENLKIEVLEDPLEGQSTSLADRCFKLGTVQFGLNYNSSIQREVTESDSTRRESENYFYEKLLQGTPDNVFFVPIHVNGSAWLALYQVFPKSNKHNLNQWSINYEIYNQYILLISEKIRLISKDIFLNTINSFIEKVATEVTSLDDFVYRINENMNIISCFFPYPVPIFKVSEIQYSIDDYLLRLDKESFQIKQNKLWIDSVNHDKIIIDELNKQINTYCHRIGENMKNKRRVEEMVSASYRISHFYGNKLSVLMEPFSEAVAFLRNQYKFDLHIEELLNEYNQNYQELVDISKLLTIISKQHTEKVKLPFFESLSDINYLDRAIFNLKENINLKFTQVISEGNRTLSVVCNKIFISPYISDANSNLFRPFDLLYNTLILEIIKNFKKGTSDSDFLTVSIDMENNLICFHNRVKKKSDEKYNYNWSLVSSDKYWGAILYLNLLLQDTKTGDIYDKYEEIESVHTETSQTEISYYLGVKLRGLRYE